MKPLNIYAACLNFGLCYKCLGYDCVFVTKIYDLQMILFKINANTADLLTNINAPRHKKKTEDV